MLAGRSSRHGHTGREAPHGNCEHGEITELVEEQLAPLLALDAPTLRTRRREKFLEMGRDSFA